MSAEKIINYDINLKKSPSISIIDEKKITKRVDINNLLARVRDKQKQESKINLIFFGLFGILIFVVAIILSF
tara:strand:- start:61 stop:276 length:216 start_codon:yes stop_codon:yes gene_type:complete